MTEICDSIDLFLSNGWKFYTLARSTLFASSGFGPLLYQLQLLLREHVWFSDMDKAVKSEPDLCLACMPGNSSSQTTQTLTVIHPIQRAKYHRRSCYSIKRSGETERCGWQTQRSKTKSQQKETAWENICRCTTKDTFKLLEGRRYGARYAEEKNFSTNFSPIPYTLVRIKGSKIVAETTQHTPNHAEC